MAAIKRFIESVRYAWSKFINMRIKVIEILTSDRIRIARALNRIKSEINTR